MEKSEEKNLIQSCIDKLNKMLGTDSSTNRALYPVVTIFFGVQAEELFPTIRETLNINWQNAEYLKYLHIVKCENKFQCTNLVTNEKGDDPAVFIEEAVVEMLGTDEYIFENKSRVRFEYVLPAEEKDGQEYYDMMLHMDLGSRYNTIKTMFLMMDERKTESRKKIRELLSYVTESREQTKQELGTIYLLSNYLRDGNVLLEHRLNQNYRLVADLILLGGSKSNNTISGIEGYNTVKTAAYVLVEKPVRSIVIVGLQKMMQYLMEENEHNYKNTASDSIQMAEKIQEKLGIQPGKINCLEEILQESIIKVLPSSAEIQYLTYLNEQEYKSIHKEKSISSVRMNQATGGNWNLFFEENYKRKLENLMSNEKFMTECMEKIEKNWRQVLSYGDCLYGLEDERVIKGLKEFLVVSPAFNRDSVEENIHLWAIEEIRKQFYAHMTRRLSDLLSEIHQNAQKFEKTYKELEKKIQGEVIDESEQNIREYYEHLTERFLRGMNTQNLEKIFRLKNNEKDIIQTIMKKLEEIFRNLIASDPIFAMTFEKEMQTRLNTMSDEDRVKIVQKVLEEKIENKVRLHGRKTSYENNLLGIYYLMNKNAGYAKNVTNPSFTIFHLQRTDCIEKIAIYDLDTSNQYCNLLEMVGEV